MLLRLLRLARNEATRHLLRSRLAWLGVVAVALVSLVWPQGLAIAGAGRDFTGFSFLRTVAATVCESVIPLFTVLLAAGLVAPERQGGTLRVLLCGPVRRSEVFAAKFAVALGYVALLLAAHVASAVVVAWGRYPFRGMEEFGEVIVSARAAAGYFAVGYALTLLPLAAVAAFGLAVSVVARGVVTAMGAAAGTLIVLTVLKPFLTFGDVRVSDWLFLSHLLAPLQRADDLSVALAAGWWSPGVRACVTTSLGALVVLLAPTGVLFARRDVGGG